MSGRRFNLEMVLDAEAAHRVATQDFEAKIDALKTENERLRRIVYQPAIGHKLGGDCIQCVPF